ncbi:MAG: RNA polymerase sigma factor RpoD/SigA [Treponema sp.]|nr:RNA polymerase sigma factor RpoD/SigA [Treponema sp.]
MKSEVNKNYISQIQKYPLLSAQEELELADRIQGGDKNALNSLINSNLRLVVSIAYRFYSANMSIMDLIQEGNMGLITAAGKFKSCFSTRFSTYAYPWIVQYMNRYASSRMAFIPLPHRKEDMIRKIKEAAAYLSGQNGTEPSSAEIAVFLSIPEEKIDRYMSYEYSVSSLDSETNSEDSGTSIIDFLADFTYNPEENYLDQEKRAHIRSLVDILPSAEKNVIYMRYNFNGEKNAKTLREISKVVGISPEAVRQIEIRALKHLRTDFYTQEKAVARM